MTPNTYYSESVFRFWVIVAIGSRRYPRDPTLLNALSHPTIDLALKSVRARASPIQAIQGLLLLCTWPFPSNSLYKDFTYTFSGSLVHMALQAGLHMPGVDQDFSRTKVAQDLLESRKRANLWCCVVLVSQTYVLHVS